ncbi:MAG: hypothetical protein HY586_03590 [Candidatus Omnitrophica bacterium]|nr:hypothetical protein [Candidatus Omnitrophota bacterium]
MSMFKGWMVFVAFLAAFLVCQPPTSYAGLDVPTEMAEEEADTDSSGELESVEPDAEEEAEIEASQHGE